MGKLANKRPVDVDDLYRMVLVGDARISPDAKRVAFVRRQMDKEKNDYVSNIWLWEDGAVRQYSSGDRDGSPRWSPDGRNLAFLSKREGSSKARLFVLPAEGGEALAYTEKNWEISGGVAWSPDGGRIAFVRSVPTDEFGEPTPDVADETIDQPSHESDKREKKPKPTKISERLQFKADGVGFVHNRRDHIFVLDMQTKEIAQITDGDCHDGSPTWSPDGRSIAFASDRNPRWDTEIDCQIWEVAASGEEPRRLASDRGSWGTPVYSPDGASIACRGEAIRDSRQVTGFARLWRIDRASGSMTDLTGRSDVEVGSSVLTDTKVDSEDHLIWNERGIWFLTSDAGAANVMRWNGEVVPVTSGLHDVRDFSVAGDRVAYTRSDLTAPAEVFLQSGAEEPQRLTTFNDALLEEVELAVPVPVTFAGSKGEVVWGWITKPTRPADLNPLIVYIHGGPQAAYGNSFMHEMQFLAGHGYGLLLINPHGSGSLGELWVSSIHGDWGKRDFEDVMAATDLAASLDWVDESRLGVGGGSYGGYMASWTIGHTDRFAAALIERSLVNMLSFVGTTDVPNWWQYAWRATIDVDPMKLWSMSPIAYLSHMATPSLIIHSENDHRCPVEQGEQIFTGLRQLGVPTRFVRFPDESHGLSRGGKPSRRVERLNEIAGWFDRYLKPNEEPDGPPQSGTSD
ncbi:MAG TPA: S9 family peptidase [Chloroflexota bacterium]|nr:S9 family peptidase [Chloroflexota bacterium]